MLPKASILLAITLRATADVSTCYYPDGSVSPDVPCNSTSTQSACCGSSSYCLSNGVCLNDGILSRGSCTDENWSAAECCPYCTDDNPTGGMAIMPCSNSTFTCGFNHDNCDTSSSIFTMSNLGAIVLKSSQLTSAMQAAGLDVDEDSSTPTSDSSSGSTTAISILTVTATPSPSPQGYAAATLAGVPLGVGIPLLLAIGALSYLLHREKRSFRSSSGRVEFHALHQASSSPPGMRKEANSWLSWSETSQPPQSRPTELGSEVLIQELGSEEQRRVVELETGRR